MIHNKEEEEENQDVQKVIKKDDKDQTNDSTRNVSTHGQTSGCGEETDTKGEQKRSDGVMVMGSVGVERHRHTVSEWTGERGRKITHISLQPPNPSIYLICDLILSVTTEENRPMGR